MPRTGLVLLIGALLCGAPSPARAEDRTAPQASEVPAPRPAQSQAAPRNEAPGQADFPTRPKAEPPAAPLSREEIEQIVRKVLQEQQAKEQPAGPAPAGEKPPTGDPAAAAAKAPPLSVVWQNGVQMETADKAFRLHVGGLIHADGGWWTAEQDVMFGPGGVGPLNDGALFRRARLHMNGSMYDNVNWSMEVGFENRVPQFFDVYGELPRLPCGTLRVGHFREPFGMDALTSYNNLTFLERAVVQDPFVPFFNTGVMIYGDLHDQSMTYATGVFRTKSDLYNGADFGDGNYSYTSRLTANPWHEDDGAYALHLGAAHSYRVLPRLNAQGQPVVIGGERGVIFNARPEERVDAPSFLWTPFIRADHSNLLGAEFGLGLGQFLVQAEYMAAYLNDAAALIGDVPYRGNLYYQGFYAQASWFLTGENRPYVRDRGIFGQVKPLRNFAAPPGCGEPDALRPRGPGAWEVAVRYSQADLESNGVAGGELRDLTIGVNWYLNPQCRFVWNYVLIWRNVPGNGSDGLAQAFGVRFQLEF